MKYIARKRVMRPRSVVLLAVLLAVVSTLTFQIKGELNAQNGSDAELAAPRLTATSIGGNSIELRWTSVSGAVRYELMTWTSGYSNWVVEDDGLTVTTYKDDGLSEGTNYFYVVRGVAADGTEGPWSNNDSAVAYETLPPPATATSTAAPTPTPTPTVQGSRPVAPGHLSNPPASNPPTSGSEAGSARPGSTSTSTATSTATPAQTLTPTATSTATPPATASEQPVPSVPDLRAEATEQGVALSWEAVPNAVRYELIVWREGGSDWQAIGGDNLTGTSYTHASVEAGTKYSYSILAVNAAGETSGWLLDYPAATALATVSATATSTPTFTPTPTVTLGPAISGGGVLVLL